MASDDVIPMPRFQGEVEPSFYFVPINVANHFSGNDLLAGTILSNAHSNASLLSSTPALRATPTKRSNCPGSSALRLRDAGSPADRFDDVAFMPNYLALPETVARACWACGMARARAASVGLAFTV
jgi:hypothetical protein